MLIYLEFSLELCWATGSVIPHVFYVSQRGFWVLCWRIKALFGGTCSLTIQLDKLNFPCNLNKLCQNVNCARIQSYLLTPSECVRFPSHPHSPFKMENSFGCLCPSPSHPPGKLLWQQFVIWDNPGHFCTAPEGPLLPIVWKWGIPSEHSFYLYSSQKFLLFGADYLIPIMSWHFSSVYLFSVYGIFLTKFNQNKQHSER